MGLRAGSLRRSTRQRGPGMHIDADYADAAEALPQVSQVKLYPGQQSTSLLRSVETGNVDMRLIAIGDIMKRLCFNHDMLI